MKAIKFKESNIIYAENQREYLPLHAHKTISGVVTSCWKPSFKERINILFGSNIYLRMLTFNKPLQPVILTINKPDLG